MTNALLHSPESLLNLASLAGLLMPLFILARRRGAPAGRHAPLAFGYAILFAAFAMAHTSALSGPGVAVADLLLRLHPPFMMAYLQWLSPGPAGRKGGAAIAAGMLAAGTAEWVWNGGMPKGSALVHGGGLLAVCVVGLGVLRRVIREGRPSAQSFGDALGIGNLLLFHSAQLMLLLLAAGIDEALHPGLAVVFRYALLLLGIAGAACIHLTAAHGPPASPAPSWKRVGGRPGRNRRPVAASPGTSGTAQKG